MLFCQDPEVVFFPLNGRQTASRHVLFPPAPHTGLCLPKLHHGKKHTHQGTKEQEEERLQQY